MEIVPFSRKQLKLLTWWTEHSPYKSYFGIIADGAIRAGKTFPCGLGFNEWAFAEFDQQNFLMCGKTVGSFRRNVLDWWLPTIEKNGYKHREYRQDNMIVVTGYGKENKFHVFGGRDESSQNLVQGITAAGALFDEVALMPRSFVNQATGRLSVEGAKVWFNCNPDSPSHFFKTDWIDQAEEKKLLRIHFTMDDNPSMSDMVKARYRNMYSGVFYQRFIQGLWVMAEGSIYDMFSEENIYDELPLREHLWENGYHFISADYGTQNATVFGHFIDDGHTLWLDSEYYHSGRSSDQERSGQRITGQKTDAQYADEFQRFVANKPTNEVVLDPSAASFKLELRNRGVRVVDADNEVLDGIRHTSTLFQTRRLKINRSCRNTIREIQSYVWDPKPTEKGQEEPLKKDDHGPDMVRYACKTKYHPRRLQF
jgi:PBSX family phage terminase large subunit